MAEPALDRAGLLGWLDPRGRLSPLLCDWLRGLGAACALGDGAFQLWRRPGCPAQVYQAGGRIGALLGRPYGTPRDQAVPAVLEAQSAGRLHRLEGRLALILWERDRQRLSLFRDGSSAQGLYYRTVPGGGLIFSDDLDLLVGSPAAQRRIARRSLHEYLRFMDVSTPNTIYEGVYSSEPGVVLSTEPGAGAPEPQPCAVDPPPEVPAGFEAAVQALDQRLCGAVAKRLDPEGPVLAFLSGGVDSSLIAAIAGRAAPGRVRTLTLGFAESGFDEAPIAAAIAAHLGLPHEVLRLPMADYRAAFDDWTSAIAYPFADPAAVPTLLALGAARALAPYALDGTGADTLLGLMPARHYRRAARFGTWIPRRLRPPLAAALRAAGPLAGLAPMVDFDDPQELLIRWRSWTRRDIERLCGEAVSLEHTRFYRIYRDHAPHRHFERYSRLMGSLPDDRLHEASRITGLEVRFPFFDPELADFVRALPVEWRYRDGEHKVILRQVLARYLPRPLWDLPKHGFDFPLAAFLALDDQALIRDYLSPDLVRDSGLVDPALVAQSVARLGAGDLTQTFRVWSLLVLFAWMHNHWGGVRLE